MDLEILLQCFQPADSIRNQMNSINIPNPNGFKIHFDTLPSTLTSTICVFRLKFRRHL
jgi:hypothetical protein